MQEFAEKLYKSTAWRHTAKCYASSVGGLCEECLRRGIYRPAEVVHHKIHLTPANIENPEIALDWNNLEALCRQCHGEKHRAPRRFRVDPETGRIEIPLSGEKTERSHDRVVPRGKPPRGRACFLDPRSQE